MAEKKISSNVSDLDDDKWPKSYIKTAHTKNVIVIITGVAVVGYIIFKIFICGCGVQL